MFPQLWHNDAGSAHIGILPKLTFREALEATKGKTEQLPRNPPVLFCLLRSEGLYGVTMQEPGISRLVSVRSKPAEEVDGTVSAAQAKERERELILA